MIRSGIRQGYPFSSFLFNFILEVLAKAKDQKRKLGKKEIKPYLYRDYMIFNVDSLNKSAKIPWN